METLVSSLEISRLVGLHTGESGRVCFIVYNWDGKTTVKVSLTCVSLSDGRLKPGDEILMVDGKSLVGLTHSEAVGVLKRTQQLVQLVVATEVSQIDESGCVNALFLSPSSASHTGIR